MAQHGVNLARIAREQGKRTCAVKIAATRFDQKLLEVSDVLVDRRVELWIDPVTAADLHECLSALGCVEPSTEKSALLAALIATPHILHSLVVDHGGDVER